MLESLPWPKHLKNVPEYAGGHHERMDGKGYPRGLTREQMSVQARVDGDRRHLRGAHRKDRPYKKGKTLTEALTILGRFKLNGHIDPDLFDIFIRERSICNMRSNSWIRSRSTMSICPRSLACPRMPCRRASPTSDIGDAARRGL